MNAPTTNMYKLIDAYNAFQNTYGQSNGEGFDTTIGDLFSPDFRKVANGVELVTKREGLQKQLEQAKNFAGTWRVEPTEVLPVEAQNKCTLRYFLHTERAGNLDVIAIITSKDGIKIDVIDEVYCHLK